MNVKGIYKCNNDAKMSLKAKVLLIVIINMINYNSAYKCSAYWQCHFSPLKMKEIHK